MVLFGCTLIQRSPSVSGRPAMDAQNHWEKVYTEKASTAVSWYRPHRETSLSLIERITSRNSAIIDVGGGESTLVDDLLSHGYENITILDVSQTGNQRKWEAAGRSFGTHSLARCRHHESRTPE